ncbi:MAG: DNA polymerase III subunit delta' [Acidobacteria bacterium]|nr:DNA polymerase III subunit delta' [Acidobacteriota bacterium]
MGFRDFFGNEPTVHGLREMLARRHFPHALILAGPAGAGKYTLAQMLAKALNCARAPLSAGLSDFCGECPNCTKIAQSDDFDARFAEAVEAREGLREADKKDTRIFLQSHPEVLVVPPDPPQMMIKVGQVRHVIETIYYRPSAGRERVYIFTSSSFMKEAANSLLKVLEEPPEFATLFLLAENPGELLPTIRSRCFQAALAPLSALEIEALLGKRRPGWNPRQRALVARLSGGAVGTALTFHLEAYVEARNHALAILGGALSSGDHSVLFQTTDQYRASADGRDKTEQLLRVLYGLLEDVMFLQSGAPELVRNTDVQPQIARLAASTDFAWLSRAAQGLGQVESGIRRNLLRSLSLDAFAIALEQGTPDRAPR